LLKYGACKSASAHHPNWGRAIKWPYGSNVRAACASSSSRRKKGIPQYDWIGNHKASLDLRSARRNHPTYFCGEFITNRQRELQSDHQNQHAAKQRRHDRAVIAAWARRQG
jgi:hypothetical protein